MEEHKFVQTQDTDSKKNNNNNNKKRIKEINKGLITV